MKLTKLIKYGILTLVVFFIGIFILNIYLYSLNKDIDDVTLSGYVYHNRKPITKAILKINNAIYEGGDSESYGKYTHYLIETDNNGFYNIKFKKSAYIRIKVLKNGFSQKFKSIEVSKKQLKENFNLEKIP